MFTAVGYNSTSDGHSTVAYDYEEDWSDLRIYSPQNKAMRLCGYVINELLPNQTP